MLTTISTSVPSAVFDREPIRPSETDPQRVAAFFDLDETIVRGNTGKLCVQDLYRDGLLSFPQLLHVSWVLLRYKLSLVDMERVLSNAAMVFAGTPKTEIAARCERLFDIAIRSRISSAAVTAIIAHQRLGHDVVLLTAQSEFIAAPICRELAIGSWLCTRLEEVDGLLTGQLDGPACYGVRKTEYAREFAKRHGISIPKSYFYTDSYSDLPMLELVKERRVVNPDPRLRLEARRRGWPILEFED